MVDRGEKTANGGSKGGSPGDPAMMHASGKNERLARFCCRIELKGAKLPSWVEYQRMKTEVYD